MADKPITKLYKDIALSQKGKLFSSAGRAGRLRGRNPIETARLRRQAESASMDVRVEKTLKGEGAPSAIEARIRQKQALNLGRLSRMARTLGRIGSKLGAIGQIATLPSQIEEYKEMMKPLHKKEQERSARRM